MNMTVTNPATLLLLAILALVPRGLVAQQCLSWCAANTNPNKCTWMVCSACEFCFITLPPVTPAPYTPAPVAVTPAPVTAAPVTGKCLSWCAANMNPNKCNWDVCSGCDFCYEPGTAAPVTAAPATVVTPAPITPAPVPAVTPAPITTAPVVPVVPSGDCFSGCTNPEGQLGWCGKTTGCEGCEVPATCEILCSKCVDRAQDFGGLDCGDCSGEEPVTEAPVTAVTPAPITPAPVPAVTTAPVVPSGPCFAGCTNPEGQLGWCGKTTGCEGCEVPATCEILCIKCEGRAQDFGGLDCPCDFLPPLE